MTRPAFSVLPVTSNFQRIVNFINTLLAGKLNVVVDLTLTPDATSTTLIDPRISAYSFLNAMPLSTAAKDALPTIYYTDQKDGQVTIHHASASATDQTMRFLIIG